MIPFSRSLLLTSLFSVAVYANTPVATPVANVAPVMVPKAPEIAAKTYILIDYASGQVISEYNADEQLPPASLTKLMTSYIIGNELAKKNISGDDLVTISNNAWSRNFADSSKMFIEVGKQVKVSDLNQGIVVQSGNDACVAMAEYLAGSVDSFANQMNAWAAKLGMTHSHFVNPHGLYDEQHYSTARDMATLGMALIRDLPDQYALHSQRSFTFNNITQHNRNRLLWDQSLSVDGMKTGYVSQVGYNLVASATDPDGMRLISVIMGSSNERIRSDETKKLLTYGFRFFQNVTPYKAGSELVNQTIWMGDKSKIKLGVDKNVTVLVKRGQTDNLTADFQLDRELRAPIAKGERVGTLRVRQGDNELTSVALVALEEVNEGSFIRRLLDYITLMITGLFK